MGVGDDVDQLAGLQTGHLRHHVDQHAVLHHVPVVGGQHVLAALVQDGVEGMSGDVERHGVSAGVQGHLVEVLKVVDVGEDTAAGGVVLQVVQHAVYLIHLALGVLVLYCQLIAVGLADGAGLIRPAVPDVATQVVDIVGLLLPDPQQLVDAGLEVGAAQRQDGKLLTQVVAVDDTELFHGVGRRAVIPVGTHLLVSVPHPVLQDVAAILLEDLVCTAHGCTP